MFKSIFKSPGALFYAILVHVILFAILTVSLDWTSEPEEAAAPVNIVKATSIDEKKVEDQLKKLKDAEQDRINKEKARQKKLDQEAEQARKQRQAEELRLRELEKRRLLEKRELEKQKIQKQEELAKLEKQKIAKEQKLLDLKKKREAEQQERVKEQKRLAQVREEKKRLEDEARQRKIEEEKRRKAEEEEMLRQAMLAEEKALLQDQMAAEEATLAAEREKQAQSVIAQYVGLIRQKIERNWRRPSGSRSGLSCEVFVRLIPGGGISHVEITKSSGDGIFDSSVEQAIRKAEPLPVPPDPDLFDRFRDVRFEFKPEQA